ncbi:uncharacterized protein LOC121770420 [Salvia splendens]|uniref:uncharacterized protein LOC121770420 n=1 Tax=Salvia splendens TaxID=180675 RepID=UPI001C259ADB|nr:uncharacterized protein LOC121770420 [Salvia splendens]
MVDNWEQGDSSRQGTPSYRAGSRGRLREGWHHPSSNGGRKGDDWMGNVMTTNKYYSLMANGEFDVDGCEEEDMAAMDIQPLSEHDNESLPRLEDKEQARDKEQQIVLLQGGPSHLPGYDGADFTWAKNGLFERLDRLFVNEVWSNAFEATRLSNLPRISSDHGPILARCTIPRPPTRGSAFRFQNMWVRHEGFKSLIQDVWEEPTGASGLLNLQIKLARSKKALKAWNREVFSNIHSNLQEMEVRIAQGQADFEADLTPRNRTEINKSIAEYILLLRMEEDFWRQKAALRWLPEGDKNTKFYQSWVKQKRVRLRIHSIHANGREIADETELRNSAVEFFRSLLAPDNPTLVEPDIDLIQELPPTPALMEIHKPPDAEEVKRAVFLGAYLPRSITATNIVLILKKASPGTWADFRPISLCNVLNKIITKVLTARLGPFLPQVISPNQSGFVKGRLLHDNVLMAQEMFHEIARCSPAPNVAIKIDMAKAYDRVQWIFLTKVLRRMGFPDAWISLVERCIGSCWFSVLINGVPAGFFKSTRGLRQGDPISLALFVIAADYLSRALDKLILGKKEMVFKTSRKCMEISHLAYADDIIIFTQAAAAPMRWLRACLDNYVEVSGQQINLDNSNFYIADVHEQRA